MSRSGGSIRSRDSLVENNQEDQETACSGELDDPAHNINEEHKSPQEKAGQNHVQAQGITYYLLPCHQQEHEGEAQETWCVDYQDPKDRTETVT